MNRRKTLFPAAFCAGAIVFAGGAGVLALAAAEVNVKGNADAADAAPAGGKGEAGGDGSHVGLEMAKNGIAVKIDGELFTVYQFDESGTPIFYPVIGPHGENITRHYPMRKGVEGESTDHEHHRSIWFGHRKVNGTSFWGARPEDGKAVHRGVRHMHSGGGGKPAVIVVENDMMTAGGEAVFSDEREFRITAFGKGEVLLEYIVTIKADKGVDLTFGNEKDGTMAIRFAPWLDYENRKGERGTGEIVNSEGVEGKDAWGKRADWVDYHGTAPDGGVYGAAMFDHPSNLRHPTWWHARTYGLLSANPFGQGAFEKGTAPPDAGEYTVKKGDALKLHYAFYFHRGNAEQAKVAERYAAFAKGGKE